MRKKVYVIYTGGTLGMQKNERGYRPVAHFFEQQLRAQAELNSADMPEFDVHEYSPLLDSSDIRPEHWQKIAQDITSNYADYDGFVVLHGTDTMAYTAAALHYLFPNLTKPVILTGAQIPLVEPHSDTLNNVRNALFMAAFAPFAQVAVLFQRKLLAAPYVTKFDAQSLDGFASPRRAPLLQWKNDFCSAQDLTAITKIFHEKAKKSIEIKAFKPKKISVLHFFPGMDFELLAAYFQQPWDAVILLSFGSGNIPQHPVLQQQLRGLSERGVKLINCSQCPRGEVEQKYASGYFMADIGVVFAGDKTLEAALAWAHIEL